MSTLVTPRTTRPGLPQKTTKCPKCHTAGCWAASAEGDGTHDLGCWNCGTIVASWEPGDADWILVPRYRPAGAPGPALVPPVRSAPRQPRPAPAPPVARPEAA